MYIPTDWVTFDGGWCQQILSTEALWYLMGLKQCVTLGDLKDIDKKKDYSYNISFNGILTYAPLSYNMSIYCKISGYVTQGLER